MTTQNMIGRAYSSTPTATTIASWDNNANLSANNFLAAYTTTVTAAATTTLTVASTASQFFTGSTTQTITLPVTSTLVLGQHFYVVNNSSGAVTIQSSGGNTIQIMAAGTTCNLSCILTSGTSAASWYAEYAFQSGSSTGTVNSGLINQLAWYAANGTAVSGLTIVNSAALTTTAGGVPTWVAYTGTGAPVLGTSPTITTPNIVGTATNNNASAGSVGEYVSSNIPFASSVSITSTVTANITSISLTAGDWDVWGSGGTQDATGGMLTLLGISTTSATMPDQSLMALTTNVGQAQIYAVTAVPSQRLSLSGTTTVYLVVNCTAVGTITAFGNLAARRRR